MKLISLSPLVDQDTCNGCVVCSSVCPTLAITLVDRKAVVKEEDCRGCGACDQRCPVYAISMHKLDVPYTVGVAAGDVPYDKIEALCLKANLNPQQLICYCTTTRAEEVAAAILKGATSPEELSRKTGIRTGCKVECIAARAAATASGRNYSRAASRLAMVWVDARRLDHPGRGQGQVWRPGILF